MKAVLTFLPAIFFGLTSVNDPIDRIGVKGPLVFNETNFNLAWSDHPNDHYYIQEYLIEGEKVESFNQMLTIHLFLTDVTVEKAVGLKVNELTERKKTDAVCNYQVTESADGKEFMVDFLLSESKGEELGVVEFNICRYKQVEISKTEKAIFIYTYSKRAYGEGAINFLKALKEDRMKYLKAMTSSDIPAIKIENK